MKEFTSIFTFADEKEHFKDLLKEAGALEVYETGHWEHLDNFHADYIGEYMGDDWSVIPDHAEVRACIMDAEDYEHTLLANCSGCDAEDYICEETGKVLIVQFYVPEEGE